MKHLTFLLIAITFLLQSCVLDQTYTIHKDGSGSFGLNLDMKELLEMGGEEQNLSEMDEFQNMDSLKRNLPSSPGISNLNFEVGETNISFSLDCESWDAFADLQNGLEDDQKLYTQGVNIATNGKKVTLDCSEMLKAILESEDDEASELNMGIMSMLVINYHFNFDRKIKKVKGDVATWDKESNSIHITYDKERSPDDYVVKVWLK